MGFFSKLKQGLEKTKKSFIKNIETVVYGYAEIDDVILNTMGFAIGFWVYRFLLKFLKFHATLN